MKAIHQNNFRHMQ